MTNAKQFCCKQVNAIHMKEKNKQKLNNTEDLSEIYHYGSLINEWSYSKKCRKNVLIRRKRNVASYKFSFPHHFASVISWILRAHFIRFFMNLIRMYFFSNLNKIQSTIWCIVKVMLFLINERKILFWKEIHWRKLNSIN